MLLRRLVADAASVSSVNVLRLLAQVFVVPVLARVLSPTDYGLVGMSMPFITLGMILADAGVGMSLIRTPASQRRAWSTCFWLVVALGTAITALLACVAPLAVLLLGEPRLRPMVMTLACVVLAQALATVPGAMLQQQCRFKAIAIIEITAVLLGIATAVVMAFRGAAAWALIGQQLAYVGVKLVLTWLCAPFWPLWTCDVREVKEQLVFGGHLLGVNLVSFFTRSLDNLVIGTVLGAAAVGVYSMTFQFARLPMMIVTGPLISVLYPRLIEIQADIDTLRRILLSGSRVLAIFMFPVIGLVAASHSPVFSLLLSDKWSMSGRLFLLVAPACALQAVTALCGTVRMALGRTDIQLKVTVEFGILWLTALLTGVTFGLEWLTLAYTALVLIYGPRSLMLVLPLIDCPLRTYLRILAAPALVTLICVSAFAVFNHLVSLSPWGQLCVAAVLAALAIVVNALAQTPLFARSSEYRM